jgi:preprotein translocase subunit SecA
MSAEDELIQRFVPAPMRNRLVSTIENQRVGSQRLAKTALSYAQRAAQRLAFRQRKNVLQMDTWLEEALSFTGSGQMF